MLNRRPLIGSLIAALMLTLAVSSAVDADRYQNQSGLALGRFVWSPTLASEGPVTIVVSPAERSVHVYRDGVEIGISTIANAASASIASGVFVVSEINGRGGGASDAGLVWRGTELFVGQAEQVAEGGMGARLPRDFAELLMEATHRGAAVIVARERSGPQLFSAPGPFVDPLETGSVNRVARFAAPELRQQLVPTAPPEVRAGEGEKAIRPTTAPSPTGALTGVRGEITSLVLSRADLSAYVLTGGRLVDRLPIAVDRPTEPLGLHAAVLVAPGDERREAKWLAFGLDEDADAAHVATDQAERALRRVRFMDRGRSVSLARSLNPGAVVVLMDGHGPSATEAPRFDVTLLQSEDAAVPPPVAGLAPISAAEGNATERASSSAATSAGGVAGKSARSGAKPRRARTSSRRRGPLEQREPWPNSMYWPY